MGPKPCPGGLDDRQGSAGHARVESRQWAVETTETREYERPRVGIPGAVPNLYAALRRWRGAVLLDHAEGSSRTGLCDLASAPPPLPSYDACTNGVTCEDRAASIRPPLVGALVVRSFDR